MSPALVVLAAGRGRRFGGSKQLAPVGPRGEALLEYSVYDALRAGFGRVILVVRRDSLEAFHRRFAAIARHLPLELAPQRRDDLPLAPPRGVDRDKPWGTGQAVLAAAGLIDRPFAVVNADDYYGAASFGVLGEFLSRSGRPDCLAAVGFRLADTLADSGPVSRALLEVDASGRLRRAVERREVWREDERVFCRDESGERLELSGDELVSMNMWGFTPALLAPLRRLFAEFLAGLEARADAEFLLPDAVQALVAAGRFRVEVLPAAGEWCGLTYRRDGRAVRSFLAAQITRGLYPSPLWS